MRYMFVTLNALGMTLTYMLSVNLSINLIPMVNYTAIRHLDMEDNHTLITSPCADNISITEVNQTQFIIVILRRAVQVTGGYSMIDNQVNPTEKLYIR